jgi:peptidoglycan hydrolase-like protein with peptidoglycan-binding domain
MCGVGHLPRSPGEKEARVMSARRVVVTSVVGSLLLAGAAYAVGLGVLNASPAAGPELTPRVARPVEAVKTSSPTPVEPVGPVGTLTPAPVETSSPTPVDPVETPAPTKPAVVLRPGDKGAQVRDLQARLFQLQWLPETTTGTYDATTRQAVQGFQVKRHLKGTGVLDRTTWRRLKAATRQPTHDAMYNVLHAGPALLESGDSGDRVRDAQARLKQIAWIYGDVTGSYDATTVAAVKGFQAKRGIPVTGQIDQRTMDRLDAMTSAPSHEELFNIPAKPGELDPRCRTGRVLCIDKTSRTLRWVIDGKVQLTLAARFGSTLNDTPTREGLFHVYLMDADHVSKLYGSSMPYSMFFSGGQAVHYSSDFAAVGYYGASHGCVNIRDYDGIKWLFSQVHVGDAVVVYWS